MIDNFFLEICALKFSWETFLMLNRGGGEEGVGDEINIEWFANAWIQYI